MKKIAFFVFLLAAFIATSGYPADNHHPSYQLQLAYNGSILYPGASLGIAFPIASLSKSISRPSSGLTYIHDRLIPIQLSWYHHASFHDNVYLTAGWTMRKTHANGLFTEFTPAMGISRTFLGGTTYRVDQTGSVKKESLAGYYYALLAAGWGIGYDFKAKQNLPVRLFTKLNLIALFPYNSTIYPRPTLEIGIILDQTALHHTPHPIH